jgi:hypothetical protein
VAETPKTFDTYEYVAVIAPGAIVSLGLTTVASQLKVFIGDKPSLGEFGIFLIVAFALGHVVQAFGNLWEALLWALFGRPTDSVRRLQQTLLSPDQRTALEVKASEMEGRPLTLAQIPKAVWHMMVVRMYNRLNAADATDRIDTFNRTYGLLRGLSVAFVLLGAWLLVAHAEPRSIVIAFVFAAALTARMFRVSYHYARTLFLRFIDLPAPGG